MMEARQLLDELAKLLLDEEEEEEEQQQQQQSLVNQAIFRQHNNHIRMLRDLSNPFSIPTHHFIRFYRMSQETTLRLIQLIEHQLVSQRSTKIPVHLQVLLTLRFMAEGQLQRGLAQDYNHPVRQPTASRCIHRVLDAIVTLHDQFIQFPTTQQARVTISNRRTIRIPNIIGIVDCFLVSFKKPAENEVAFFNYRVGCSMNVQIITDSDYNILNVRVCPGSNNDRFVWQLSEAKEYMEYLRNDPNIVREEGQYYILANSGYTLSPTVLTPVLNAAQGSPADSYTTEHVGTRRYVEQTIGILSGVWMAIERSRKLHYSPIRTAIIINAACILHNFRKRNGIPNAPHQLVPRPLIDGRANTDYPAGLAERNRLIELLYN